MTKLLVKLFIKNSDQTQDAKVRQKYGMLGGIVGIVCNIFLFAAKFLAGLITSSISVMADAFNNLSDAGSSLVTLVGFKMAGMPADNQHPFGHGRIEYVSGLIVSMVIMLMGFELGKTSMEKIFRPEEISFGILPFVILLLSIGVKLWMGFFNKNLGEAIDSAAMKATAMDSLSDVAATAAVVVGMLVHHFWQINIDPYVGVLVALFILYTGLNTARDTLNPLLGQPPEKEFVDGIVETVMSYEYVVGIHDLIVHNYGPGRSIVSLHAEVPCDENILKLHDTIDLIERDLKSRFDCEAVIHMDPVATDDKVLEETRKKVEVLVQLVDMELRIHDFRMVEGETHTNLIFDVVVPHKFRLTEKELVALIGKAVKTIDEKYEVVVNVDRAYIDI